MEFSRRPRDTRPCKLVSELFHLWDGSGGSSWTFPGCRTVHPDSSWSRQPATGGAPSYSPRPPSLPPRRAGGPRHQSPSPRSKGPQRVLRPTPLPSPSRVRPPLPLPLPVFALTSCVQLTRLCLPTSRRCATVARLLPCLGPGPTRSRR